MDAIPLPARPHLEQYRKRAKELAAAARSANPHDVQQWVHDWAVSLARAIGTPVSPFAQSSIDRAIAHIVEHVRVARERSSDQKEFALADAQFAIARAHGFESWAGFARHLDALEGARDGAAFEAAADAVVGGDVAQLRALLARQPELIRARSARVHRATLLHYVAANGVEDFRQETPPDAVEIARVLLEAGAEVDATANAYSGGAYDTTMNLLVSSVHPAAAGLQCALVETLIDFGAAADGPSGNETPIMTALDFGYPDAAETLSRRGARIDTVLAAAALGRVDLLRRFVVGKDALANGVALIGPPWLRLPNEPTPHLELALVWAARYGRTGAVGVLLDAGVDPVAADRDGMTALHWAAANGALEVIRELVRRRAPLEAKNRWGGTVLDSTRYFATRSPVVGVDYDAVVRALAESGGG